MAEPGRAACMCDDLTPEELTCTERVAKLMYWLSQGEGVRTIDAAKLVGCTRQHTWRMLCTMSRVTPIYQDDDGFWQMCVMKEVEYLDHP